MMVTSLQLWAEKKLNVKEKAISFTSSHITDSDTTVCHKSTQKIKWQD